MIIYNTRLVKTITLGFADGITLFPFILLVDEARGYREAILHERIHLRQQAEMLVVGFYLVYMVILLVNLVRYRNFYRAYSNVFFEREAYANHYDAGYLKKRKPFASFRYL